MAHRMVLGLGLGLGLALGVAAPALAAPGYATGNVNLRAGPGPSYPRVAMIAAGAPVEIFGCLDGYNWCDVGVGGARGWVAGSYLQYAYQGQRVLVPEYGPRIGVPIIGFDFGDYWGRYYRGRPWYSVHDRWGGPPPPPHRPGPPPGWHGRPPGPGWGPPGRPPGPEGEHRGPGGPPPF
ncbi:SH3 domain-containing protein [Roseomonas gilardii]|uniref:SH3 domain-containing protein n=1 Tax=Roseomonas gilardii TaxID=257708 RepID=UPI0024A69BDA|nr:SH3 domain-containing protein [Roseomonas gilardii]